MTTDLAAPQETPEGLEAVLVALQADADLAARNEVEGFPWLPSWFLRQLDDCDRAEERIKQFTEVALAQVRTRRNALKWKWGRQFEHQVKADIMAQPGKKKSVTYPDAGKAGVRTSKEKLVVTDGKALTAWCVKNCKAALKIEFARIKPVKEHFDKTGEDIPGVKLIEKSEKFYPEVDPPTAEQIQLEYQKALYGGDEDARE